jgi:1-acyl-sn-glycerol-3-phosphate acyltransferase
VNRWRPWVVLALFAGLTLPLMPLQRVFVWFWPRMARAFPMHYHRLVCHIMGIRIEVTGMRPERGPLLIASNHISWLDIVILSATAPVSFIAKRDVASWPFFGTLARLQRTVFVDRERRQATGEARDNIRARLQAGEILVLFPEGTSSDGRHVLPFKSSFFGAADIEGVAVQPISLAYRGHRNLPMNRRLLPSYAWYGDMGLAPHLLEALTSGPIEVSVICHAPLSLSGEKNRKALARHAENEVRKGLRVALHDPGKIG